MKEELIVFNSPKSRMSEAIKTIRTNLQFSSIDKEIKVILLTSSMPGEGKSFISSNLACAFAAVDKKVLLIDCDLRRGRQHKIFGVSNNKGLSNLLISNIDSFDKYIQGTHIPNVSILPMGVLPPNPSELLGSSKNKNLINKLKDKYDIIILDCPPVSGLADTVTMTTVSDAVVLVSSVNKLPAELLEKSKKTLEQVNAPLAGVIINNVEDGKNAHYYDSYYN